MLPEILAEAITELAAYQNEPGAKYGPNDPVLARCRDTLQAYLEHLTVPVKSDTARPPQPLLLPLERHRQQAPALLTDEEALPATDSISRLTSEPQATVPTAQNDSNCSGCR